MHERVVLHYAGANDGGDRPTHVMASPEAVWHAGLRVRWVRWVRYAGETVTEGPWERVTRE